MSKIKGSLSEKLPLITGLAMWPRPKKPGCPCGVCIFVSFLLIDMMFFYFFKGIYLRAKVANLQ